jgi:hypothetical protein
MVEAETDVLGEPIVTVVRIKQAIKSRQEIKSGVSLFIKASLSMDTVRGYLTACSRWDST